MHEEGKERERDVTSFQELLFEPPKNHVSDRREEEGFLFSLQM